MNITQTHTDTQTHCIVPSTVDSSVSLFPSRKTPIQSICEHIPEFALSILLSKPWLTLYIQWSFYVCWSMIMALLGELSILPELKISQTRVNIFCLFLSSIEYFFTDICSFEMNDEFENFLPLGNGLCLVFHRHVAGYGVKDVQGIAPTFEFEEPSRLAESLQERNDDRNFQNKCTEKYYPETVFLFQCFNISLWINLWVLFFRGTKIGSPAPGC